MSKNQNNNSQENFIQILVNLFDKQDKNEFKKDIIHAKNQNNKSKFLNYFLKKYSNS